MVPFYLCYMAGVSMSELRDDDEIAPGAQSRLVLQAVFFALGVTTIFMLLGMGATVVGQAFGQWKQPLSYAAAAVLSSLVSIFWAWSVSRSCIAKRALKALSLRRPSLVLM